MLLWRQLYSVMRALRPEHSCSQFLAQNTGYTRHHEGHSTIEQASISTECVLWLAGYLGGQNISPATPRPSVSDKIIDIGRTRTCDPFGTRFLVLLLNRSDTMSTTRVSDPIL